MAGAFALPPGFFYAIVYGAGMEMKQNRKAFTLVELLTVIAIIGVLASLMMTAVTSANKASHRARCMSNLRQISLALNMYVDDCEKRSPDLGHLTSSRYLGNRQALLCPSDKTSGWGNLVNPSPLTTTYFNTDGLQTTNTGGVQVPFSYLNPLPWENWAWDRLAKLGSRAGIAVCQLHGLGKPNLENPSYLNYQGVILRAQRDGAVVQKEVYWDKSTFVDTGVSTAASDSVTSSATGNGTTVVFAYPWRLFSDDLNP